MNDGTKVKFFGGHRRKALLQVKPHLVTKKTKGSSARSIFFGRAMGHNMAHQIQVLFHVKTSATKAVFSLLT